jgi:hypothetical protein
VNRLSQIEVCHLPGMEGKADVQKTTKHIDWRFRCWQAFVQNNLGIEKTPMIN